MNGRLHYINTINEQLARLVSQVQIAVRGNRPDINIIAENILCGLLNRIHNWSLKNANAIRQNFPGVDLVDEDHCVAVQVTSTNSIDKVRHTLDEFDNDRMKHDFEKLVVLVITNDPPTKGMKKVEMKPWFAGEQDIWNIPILMNQITDIESVDRLRQISDYLKEQLGTLDQTRYRLPPVPRPSVSFVPDSRDRELAELKELLKQEEPIFLCGLGGIGKTEVAIQLAKRYAPAEGAYFLRYAPAPQGESMRWTILQTQIDGYSFDKPDDEHREAEYRDRLRVLREHFKGALVIVDNWDGDNLNRMLGEESCQDLLSLGLRLVFTTRHRMKQRGYEIEPLDEADLLTLMRGHLEDADVTEAELLALIRAVDGHTLMADLMARTLSELWGDQAAERMLAALRRSNLDQPDFPEVASDQNRKYQQKQIYAHLRALFDLSGMNEHDCMVLRCATLLPEDGMNDELFRDSLPGEQHQPLRNLISRGWLRHEGSLLTIHPVIREVCRGELEPDDDNCADFLLELIDCLDTTQYDTAILHQMAKCFSLAAGTLEDREGTWAFFAGRVWALVGQYQVALEYELSAMEICEKALADDPLELAVVYNNVGTSYTDIGNHRKALEYCQKALAISRKELPPDHADVALYHNNISLAYIGLGEYRKALEHLRETLRIWEQMLPPEDVNLALCYNNIGLAHFYLGDPQKAMQHQYKALEIYRKVLPADHPDLALCYSNIGSTYINLGDLEKALIYTRNAVQIWEAKLLPGHPYLAKAYNNEGNIHLRQGDYSRALERLYKALDIWEKVLPPEHPDLALCYDNIGVSYLYMEDYPQALQYQRKALEIRKQILPPQHPELAQSHINLGMVYNGMKDYDGALACFQDALSIWQAVLPADHLHLALLYNNIGMCFLSQDDDEKALEALLRSKDIWEHTAPYFNPEAAKTYNNLGVTYMSLGKRQKGLEYLSKARVIWEKTLPAGHPDLALVYFNIGDVFFGAGDYRQAMPYFRKALAIWKKVLPAGHPNIANVQHKISVIRKRMMEQEPGLS